MLKMFQTDPEVRDIVTEAPQRRGVDGLLGKLGWSAEVPKYLGRMCIQIERIGPKCCLVLLVELDREGPNQGLNSQHISPVVNPMCATGYEPLEPEVRSPDQLQARTHWALLPSLCLVLICSFVPFAYSLCFRAFAALFHSTRPFLYQN